MTDDIDVLTSVVVHSFRINQVRPRRAGFERIAEILRLAGSLSFAEFHDAYGARGLAVKANHEFGPQGRRRR